MVIFKGNAFFKFTLGIFILLLISFFTLNVQATEKQEEHKLSLNINLIGATANDTLFISADNIVMMSVDQPRFKKIVQNDGSGHYQISLTLPDPYGYFVISKNRKYNPTQFNGLPIRMIKPQFYESGDSLTIDINYIENENGISGRARCNFAGKGAEKYQINHLLNYNFKPLKREFIALYKQKLKLLEQHKNKLSKISYNVNKADIIYAHLQLQGSLKSQSKDKSLLLKKSEQVLNLSEEADISDQGLANSINFQRYAFSARSGVFTNASKRIIGHISQEWIFKTIINCILPDRAKEVLLMRFLYTPFTNMENLRHVYQESSKFVQTENYRHLLTQLQLRLSKSSFTEHKLEDLKGNLQPLKAMIKKVTVIDFWFTGCGACKNFYQNVLSKVEQKLSEKRNIAFLSISVDQHKYRWKQSVDKGLYTSKKVKNFYTSGLGFQHPILKENNISAYPYVIILNHNGEVKYRNSINLYSVQSLMQAIERVEKN